MGPLEIFGKDFGKKLLLSENPNELLREELDDIKEKSLQYIEAHKLITKSYRDIMQALRTIYSKFNPEDPNLKETPERMARALIEIFQGLGLENKDIFSKFFPLDNYKGIVLLKDISFTSICSHHFFPFFGKMHIGYMPRNAPNGTRVVGLSKLVRTVDAYTSRPQIQEGLSKEILDVIDKELNPQGTMVIVEAKHECVGCRGVRRPESSMITQTYSGSFADSKELRLEFINLLKLKNANL